MKTNCARLDTDHFYSLDEIPPVDTEELPGQMGEQRRSDPCMSPLLCRGTQKVYFLGGYVKNITLNLYINSSIN